MSVHAHFVAEGGPTSASAVARHDPGPGSATASACVRSGVAEGGPTSASAAARHDPGPGSATANTCVRSRVAEGGPTSASAVARRDPGPGSATRAKSKAPLAVALLLAIRAGAADTSYQVEFGPATGILRTNLAAAMEGQTAAEERQAAAQNRLGFVAGRAAQVLELQQAAREAQAAANRAQSEVGRLLADASFKAWEIERLQSTWRGNLRRSEDAAKAWVAADAAARAARERADEAAREADEKEAAGAVADASRAVRKAAAEARRTADAAARDAMRRNQDAVRLQSDQCRFRAQATAAWPGLAQRWETVGRLRDGELATAIAASREAQAAARQAQTAAAEALRELLGEAGPAEAETDRSDPPAPPDDRPATPVELHAMAVATEARIAARYVETRAAELAVIRSVPLAVAKASVDAPAPAASAVDVATLDAGATTAEGIEAYRENLGRALEAVEAMVVRGRNLLAAVGATADAQTGQVTVAPTVGDAGLADLFEGLATDDANEPAKDLADLMDAAYAAESVGATGGETSGGDHPRSGGGHSGDAGGSGRPAPMPGGRHSARQATPNPFDVPGTGLPPKPRPFVSPGEYTDTPTLYAALPGRRVATDGLPGAEWMRIDSWYVIGPFPNPDRRYLEREFPPEAVIDLDAVYEGSDGKSVRWQFVQTGDPVVRVTESYSIYYATTDLWFDEPRILWVALGSDDGSRLYINDLLVWKTVAAKPWRINEAYRRVSFKQGRNRILYRVENGPAHGWFSFLLHVQPPVALEK